MDSTFSDSNAIDLFIKYGAAIGAVAYGFGFLEEYRFFTLIGIKGDFSFVDPRYFAAGGFLLAISLLQVPVTIATRVWLHAFRHPQREAQEPVDRYTAFFCTVLTFASIFALALIEHGWIRDALWVSTAGAAASGIFIFEIRRLRTRSRADLWEQVYPLFVIALCLSVFAMGAGKVHWRYLLAKEGQQQVRLLIEGEAVRGGAQRVGA